MQFLKAEKTQLKLRLALTGPSGSGKTYSSLAIAHGLGKKIAVIDTENNTAQLYADNFEFDTLALDPPYTIKKYLEAMNTAYSENYDVLIVDSISHAWAGEGGLLDKKGALDMRGGNTFTNWQPVTKDHELFKSAILRPKSHLICTMRSKQDYVLEADKKGSSKPIKVGMAPIQRDGIEYEFDLVLDIAMDHNAKASKSRIKDFDGILQVPSKEMGESLNQWLKSGKPVEEKFTFQGAKEIHDKVVSINLALDKISDPEKFLSEITKGNIKNRNEINSYSETHPNWINALYEKINAMEVKKQ